MSAYGSFAPATTNVWADNNYICYINCFTSFMAGFAVFSILGNMAHRQRVIAGDNPDLRINICNAYVGDTNSNVICPEDCGICGQADWLSLEHTACCGDFQTASVADGGIELAFAVRSPPSAISELADVPPRCWDFKCKSIAAGAAGGDRGDWETAHPGGAVGGGCCIVINDSSTYSSHDSYDSRLVVWHGGVCCCYRMHAPAAVAVTECSVGKVAQRWRDCTAHVLACAACMQVYPAALQFLSKGAANVLSIMWFGMLWLLGIDSMFALVEGVSTVITDTPRFRHLRKETVAGVACVLGFVGSIAFASDIGRPLLDVFDHYIINYGLFVTGSLEALTVSWIWGWQETKEKCGRACDSLLTLPLPAHSTPSGPVFTEKHVSLVGGGCPGRPRYTQTGCRHTCMHVPRLCRRRPHLRLGNCDCIARQCTQNANIHTCMHVPSRAQCPQLHAWTCRGVRHECAPGCLLTGGSQCRSAILLTWGFLLACIGGVGMSGVLHYATTPGANVGIGVAVGLVIFTLAATGAFYCRNNLQQSLREWLDVWVFAGTRNLRNTFQVRCVLCCAACCAAAIRRPPQPACTLACADDAPSVTARLCAAYSSRPTTTSDMYRHARPASITTFSRTAPRPLHAAALLPPLRRSATRSCTST